MAHSGTQHHNMADKSSKRARYSPESVASLVSSLERLKVTNPKAVNFQEHTYAPIGPSNHASTSQDGIREASDGHGDGRRYIRSWKMSEHLYRRKDCPFPTLARGLFTSTDDFALPSVAASLKGKEKVRIVARGYDKFFNAGEVDWTEVSCICDCNNAVSRLTR
jgi:tRNA ligase